MSDVEFEADVQDMGGVSHYSSRSGAIGAGAPVGNATLRPETTSNVGMVRWLVRHGVMSGEGGARTLLFSIIAINFIASGLIIYFFVLR